LSTPLNSVGAITMFVDDLGRSKSFYRDVFSLPVIFEDDESVVFGFENTVLNLLLSSAAGELIDPANVAEREAGSRFQLTVWVDDADRVCADLGGHGVSLLSGPIDRPWGQRTASFVDPDGHIWEIAQKIPDASAEK
jgi:lactoylglutathione lyase